MKEVQSLISMSVSKTLEGLIDTFIEQSLVIFYAIIKISQVLLTIVLDHAQ